MTWFHRAQEEGEIQDPWATALTALARAADIVGTGVSLNDAGAAVTSAVAAGLGADAAALLLTQEAGGALVLHATGAGAPQPGLVIAGLPAAPSTTDPHVGLLSNTMLPGHPVESSLLVTLTAGGRPFGAIYAGYGRDRRPGPQMISIAETFCRQAAALLQRVRAQEQAELRASGLASLGEHTKALLGIPELEPLLHAILEGGLQLARSEAGFVCITEGIGVRSGVFRNVSREQIASIMATPEAQAAVASDRVSPGGDGLVAVGLSDGASLRAVLMVVSHDGLSPERINTLHLYGRHCAAALAACEMNREIERKESQLNSLMMNVPDPLVLVDEQSRITTMNAAAERLFQMSGTFLTGQDVRGNLGNAKVEDALCGRGPVVDKVQIGVPPAHFRMRVTDVVQPGSSRSRLLIMEDITGERELARTQHDFVAMVGHELRTPLTVIKGYARLALKRGDAMSSEQAGEAFRAIDQRASLLERLIEDLLYVGQIEAREATLSLEPTDIRGLIELVATEVLENHPDMKVEVVVDPGLRWPCDEGKLSLVLRHLLDNACKYSVSPATVRVVAEDLGRELRLDVSDRGRGIVSTDIPHIFERFRQLDTSSTREHGGTGLGLYISSQLVKLHGGRISVDSTWGKGSTFSVLLPDAAAPAQVLTLRRVQEAG